MVALVVTALYSAIQEWHTGKHKAIEFSANTYLDIYWGNVNTLNHLYNNRVDAFHMMMCDIYSQASTIVAGGSGAQIADLELDDIEG
ncbi:hypothetical protein F5888DRAFT_1800104 [Russula emetica]|nr:hypothetical protein F5888DRAFT_1800104 [Russula emetica]